MPVKTNTFKDGLQMSFHPLNGSIYESSWTSALNATLNTDNGNLNMIQQDLGNGRVEMAYLPNGYIPLGCRELGGIIYIVSYNPFTGKGQIGSFPSPERNITSTDVGVGDVHVTQDDFFDGDRVITTNERVYPIGENFILRPGDEFLNYINYDSVGDNGEKVVDCEQFLSRDDKLRLMRIRLFAKTKGGVLTDITDKIKKVWNIDEDPFSDPDLPFVIGDNLPDINEYISGFNRNESPYVVWTENYSGELVASIELEVVDKCDIVVESELSDGSQDVCEITFTPYVDETHESLWKNGVYEKNNKLYVDEVQGYDSIHRGGLMVKTRLEDENGNYEDDFSTAYFEADENGDIVAKMSVDQFRDSDMHYLRYEVTPYMYFGPVDSLTVVGVIDLMKVNSGLYDVTKWRYYNGDEEGTYTTKLDVHVDYYPKKGYSIDFVSLKFYDLISGDTDGFLITPYDIPQVANFAKMSDFSFNMTSMDGLDMDRVYLVELIIEEYDGNGIRNNQRDSNEDRLKRLFTLNTSTMYNDEYNSVINFNTLPPKASARLSVSTVRNESESSIEANVLCDDNVYSKFNEPFSASELTRGNSMYNRVTDVSDVITDITVRYDLFKIEKDNEYSPELVFSRSEYEISGNRGVRLVGDTKSTYYKNMVVKGVPDTSDYRSAWYSLEYDSQNKTVTRIANAPVTLYGDNSTKDIDIDYKMVSMTSSEMAKVFWGSEIYKPGSVDRTIKWDEAKSGLSSHDDEYFPSQIIFYSNSGNSWSNHGNMNTKKTDLIIVRPNMDNAAVSDGTVSFMKVTSDIDGNAAEAKYAINCITGSSRITVSYPDTIESYDYDSKFLSEGWIGWNRVKQEVKGSVVLMCAMDRIYKSTSDYNSIHLINRDSKFTLDKYHFVMSGNNHAHHDSVMEKHSFLGHDGSQYMSFDSAGEGLTPVVWAESSSPISGFMTYIDEIMKLRKPDGYYDAEFSGGTERVFDGCFFMFKTGPSTFAADYNIFPSGLRYDVPLHYGNRTPYAVSYLNGRDNVVTSSRRNDRMMSWDASTCLIGRNISHEADFGQPVFKLFEPIYVAHKLDTRMHTTYYGLENLSYHEYNKISWKSGYKLEQNDDVAGNVYWNGEGRRTSLISEAEDAFGSSLSEWTNRNLVITDSTLTTANGTLSVDSGESLVLSVDSPSVRILINLCTYADTNIVYQTDSGIQVADSDGQAYSENRIYLLNNGVLDNVTGRTDAVNSVSVTYSYSINVTKYVTSYSIYNGGDNFGVVSSSPVTELDSGDVTREVFFVPSRWTAGSNGLTFVPGNSMHANVTFNALAYGGGDYNTDSSHNREIAKLEDYVSHRLRNTDMADIKAPTRNYDAQFFMGKSLKMYNILGRP